MFWFVVKKIVSPPGWSLNESISSSLSSAADYLSAEPLHLTPPLVFNWKKKKKRKKEKDTRTNQPTPCEADCCVCALAVLSVLVWSQSLLNSHGKSHRGGNSPERAENRGAKKKKLKTEKHQLTCQRRQRNCSPPKYSIIPCGNKEKKLLKCLIRVSLKARFTLNRCHLSPHIRRNIML